MIITITLNLALDKTMEILKKVKFKNYDFEKKVVYE
jgi:hypothetical protein